MKLSGGVVLGYGIIVMLGGLVGYLIAESMMSLFAGTVSGAVLVAGGMGMIRNSKVALLISLAVTALLTLFFTFRYYNGDFKFMPSGMMMAVSMLVLAMLLTTRRRLIGPMR